jgi:hypothetical protein
MSLKTFHIVFITASTLLAFGFGVWSVWGYLAAARTGAGLVLGVLSLAVGVGLVVYGRYVLRKLRNISYL